VPGFQLRSIHSQDAEQGPKVTVSALLTAEQRDDSLLEGAVSTLSPDPAVSSVGWAVLPGPDGENEGSEGRPFSSWVWGRRR
jgi:putative Mg2+ transporter-C (MgtC) family protein